MATSVKVQSYLHERIGRHINTFVIAKCGINESDAIRNLTYIGLLTCHSVMFNSENPAIPLLKEFHQKIRDKENIIEEIKIFASELSFQANASVRFIENVKANWNHKKKDKK